MKILFLFFTLLIASTIGFAQTMDESKVSSMVLTQFQSQFSEAEQVEWRKEKNFYKATFHNVANKLQN